MFDLRARFEKMAESCKQSLEVLKLSQSRGLPPPKHHFEERPFHTVRWAALIGETRPGLFLSGSGCLPLPPQLQRRGSQNGNGAVALCCLILSSAGDKRGFENFLLP